MAFRSGKRKEFKKSSYYVWFLGAKESKGLRGEEFIVPVLRDAIEKEKEFEPMKITLQLSHKGMKIVQTVPKKTNKNKTEQIKHFIPHHALTCAYQEREPDDDVVSSILLIFNPLTKCPVHVHTYRCDSSETATKLHNQLQLLISRPENQKKFREIENRLAAKGLIPGLTTTTRRTLNSDGRSTRTDDSSDSGGGHGSDKDLADSPSNISNLYDSLTAELREKLSSKKSAPLLLPPKDYDTVCRKQGKLMGIENRRSKQVSVVGPFAIVPTPKVEHDPAFTSDKDRGDCSGKSSGIGSDEALSTAIQEVSSHPDFEQDINPDTSSDEEEWTEHEQDESADSRQPLPRDEVFVQKSWRRQPPPAPVPPSKEEKPLPTYHYSDLNIDSNKGRYNRSLSAQDVITRGHERLRPSKHDRSDDRSRYVEYAGKERPDKDEELTPVYMTREEFERYERERELSRERKYSEQEAIRRFSEHDYPRRGGQEAPRYDPEPRSGDHPASVQKRYYEVHSTQDSRRDEVRYRRPQNVPRRDFGGQEEEEEGRPHYVRNKTPTRTPAHYRHSHVERIRSYGFDETERGPRPGYEIRHSNSLHQLHSSKYNELDDGRIEKDRYHPSEGVPYQSLDSYRGSGHPLPERRPSHNSINTIERLPSANHDSSSPSTNAQRNRHSLDRRQVHSSKDIPGLVDPRRKSLHLENFGNHPRGYHRGSLAEGYNFRPPAGGSRYTMTTAPQRF